MGIQTDKETHADTKEGRKISYSCDVVAQDVRIQGAQFSEY